MYTSKDRVKVVVLTSTFRIEGWMHVIVGGRLTDALNARARDFIALTNAEVYPLEGGDVITATGYLAVNRESVECVFPAEDELGEAESPVSFSEARERLAERG